ncbi:MAG: TraR/DksA family transcriptional regulator [Candidatus Magasanikbacteria bacterium]|nr:TraR/DksA family transcriptional regulator [Candidatus Magasanikbacteria bacterium]
MANTKHDEAFLADMKTALEAKKIKLTEELSNFASKDAHVDGEYNANFPEYGNEDDENAREIADFTANKPLEMAMEKELRDIGKSLQRIEEKTYGICKYCEEPIAEKRLQARPTSGSCVSCKKTLTQEA